MKERLAKLIDLKSIVTIIVTVVFCHMAWVGKIEAKDFMIVAIMIYTFYFNKRKNGEG